MDNINNTVFISYRRNVSSFIARAIFSELRSKGYDVFMDVESIDSGIFSRIILNQIAARAHFLVILSPGTIERFIEPGDWMRREIEESMRLKRNIIPVFVNGFQFDDTTAEYLSGRLNKLKGYNGINLLHDYFEAGIDKLAKRFLTDPVDVNIRHLSDSEAAAARHNLEGIIKNKKPTKKDLKAEEYYDRGFLEYKKQNYGAAVTEYGRAIKLNPQNGPSFLGRGRSFLKLGIYEEAIKDFDLAIELGPMNAKAFNHRGLAFFALGKYKKAILNFDQAIMLNPRYAKAYNNRGLAYYAWGKLKKAITDYDQAIGLNPKYAIAYYNRGRALQQMNRHEESISDYTKAIKLNPEYAEAYHDRGVLFQELGSHKKSISDLNKSKKLGY
jgi:tetratricopeptide (TPR) repeat protein